MFPKFKLMHPWFLLWALYTALFNTSAFAEQDEHDHDLQVSAQLSLHDLVEKTIIRYPDNALLATKQIEIDAKNKRASGILPAAPAIGLLNRNDAITSNRGEREWEAELELPVWLPGQRAAREALARDAALGLFALWISGEYLSVPASVGFIALLGIAVLNGVVMVSYFNQLANQGMAIAQVVIEGAKRRLRPVLMTASIAAFGLVPLLFATGPGSEIQRPLAIVVIGGLVSSTLLTLILLPMLYLRFGQSKK